MVHKIAGVVFGEPAYLERLLRLNHPAGAGGGPGKLLGEPRYAGGWTRRRAHSSERASFHDANWAGDAVTVARDRSRTGEGGERR